MRTERMTSDQLKDLSLKTLSAAVDQVIATANREPNNRQYRQQMIAAAVRLIKAVG